MPKIRQSLGADERVTSLLQFAMRKRSVAGVGREKQDELRRLVHRFLLSMLQLAEIPPRKLRWPLDYRDRYWRRFVNVAAKVEPLKVIAGENLTRHQRLTFLASELASDASFLLNAIFAKDNRPSVGFCKTCAQFWIRETKARSPTHSGSCYDEYYEKELRDRDDRRRKQESRARLHYERMATAMKLIEGHPDRELFEGLLAAGQIAPADLPGYLERWARS